MEAVPIVSVNNGREGDSREHDYGLKEDLASARLGRAARAQRDLTRAGPGGGVPVEGSLPVALVAAAIAHKMGG